MDRLDGAKDTDLTFFFGPSDLRALRPIEVVNRTNGLSFRLPLTQAELADLLGLSLVHMNRIIGELRKLSAIAWTDHSLTIVDWERLRQIAEFDATYLSMVREPR